MDFDHSYLVWTSLLSIVFASINSCFSFILICATSVLQNLLRLYDVSFLLITSWSSGFCGLPFHFHLQYALSDFFRFCLQILSATSLLLQFWWKGRFQFSASVNGMSRYQHI
jgi:hypothetical protein